ncbi:disrupted in schizophrenia 1 protein isoform X10 [Macaca nemestrina]|uniref:disrupted in schizophrenia 1 protein isoform X10 n=1 Tax=Macaca nemestrina TaxID=9545 RepID=UPI0039B87AF5
MPGSRDCLPPAACFQRRRLARRPGYMRSSTGPGIGFLSPAVGTLFRVPGGVPGEESHHLESKTRECGLDLGGLLVGSPVSKSAAAPAVTSVRGTSAHFGIQLRGGTRLPDRLSRLCGPGNAGWQQEFAAMDSSETLDTSWEAACSDGARRVQAAGSVPSAELSSNSCNPGCGLEDPPTPPGSHSAFASSFSFIQLSLGSAGERGEAEGCPPSREAESPCQSPQEMGAKAASLDGPHKDPRCLSRPFSLLATQVSEDLAQAAGNSSRPECEMHSLPDMDSGSSSSLDPSLAGCGGDGSSGSGDAHSWDTLLRKWEPVLRDCLLRNRRQVEVITLRLKLQKLQEDAVENDDYDKAETLQQRLEDLEQENINLHFQLPSRQPALSSFLGHLAAQVQSALRRGATQQMRKPGPREANKLRQTNQQGQWRRHPRLTQNGAEAVGMHCSGQLARVHHETRLASSGKAAATERNRSSPSKDVGAGSQRSTAEKGNRGERATTPVAGLRPDPTGGPAVPGSAAGGQQGLAGHPGLSWSDSLPCRATRNHKEPPGKNKIPQLVT